METVASILIVDDEPDLLENVGLALEAEGYRVLTADDGDEAIAVLQSQVVDLILADIAMPRLNGYQLYERVCENPQWVAIPFLFLSARTLDSDVRYGKELGVDDYLSKPIRAEDLLAAVRGKLRRAQQLAQASAQLTVGQLHIDSGQHRVWLDGREVSLSAKEFTLLECLAQRANQVVPSPELVQVTHGLDTDHAEAGAILRPLIRSLRRRLGYPAGEMGCIENLRGVGYRLADEGGV